MKVLFISDPHLPYTRMDLWKKLYEFNKTYRADKVVCAGDFFDHYALSRFVKSPRGDTSHTEILKCIPMVKVIGKYFPKMEILPGNHDKRLEKRAEEAGISSLFLKDILETVGAPKGWEWTKGDRVVYDGVVYCHGWLSNPVKHAEFFNESCVHGHQHSKAGLVFVQREDRVIFNVCSGFMADKDAIALNYGAIRYSTGVLAFAYVTHGVPHVETF